MAFEPEDPSGVEQMAKLVRESSIWHFKLTKEAAMGQYTIVWDAAFVNNQC